jgi:hypothetical protein
MSNLGNYDRIVRVLLGLAFVAVPFAAGWAVWSGILAAVGAVLIVTAAISFCPIYALFGLSSKRKALR